MSVAGPTDLWKTKTLPPAATEARVGEPRFYLLVLQGDSSEMFHLPATGMVVIGRSDEADLRLADDTASRSHARIITADGVARLVDLGSHNGTFVNGERVDGTRALASGDVVTIGAITMVLHAAASRAPEARPILDAASLRSRLVEEIERATRYQRPMALVDILLPAGGQPRELAATVAAAIRLIDVVGLVGEAQLAVLMPEAGGEARALAERLAQLAGGARVGLAVCPDDALDADTLFAVARAAAALARPGEVATAAAAVRELVLGDRTIVLADPAMVRLFDLIARLATSDLPVLILGETGAGKEVAARAVHHGSRARARTVRDASTAPRSPRPSSRASCSATRRAPSPAPSPPSAGCSRRASGGTLFLDEIGELPLERAGQALARARAEAHHAPRRRASERADRPAHRRRDQPRLSRTRSTPAASARISSSASAPRRWSCRRCAIAARDPDPGAPLPRRRLRARRPRRRSISRRRRCSSSRAYAWPGNVRELRNVDGVRRRHRRRLRHRAVASAGRLAAVE